ncbi:MAG: hypothetical protein OEY01_08755 [Desulfobulbaceae bacterium]|nr:hypothetical protein [Desulfobulbaceae bacterium]HIJ79093.1 hypothetical protein [Deltaproteobacteria bacterium]
MEPSPYILSKPKRSTPDKIVSVMTDKNNRHGKQAATPQYSKSKDNRNVPNYQLRTALQQGNPTGQ